MAGLVPVNGVFREVSGTGTVSPDGAASGTVTVAAASIDTKNARRDTHLRSADFFDSGNHSGHHLHRRRYPAVWAGCRGGRHADRARPNPATVLRRRGVRPADGEIWLDAEVRINRADFGVTWNLLGLIGVHSTLTVHAVFTRR